MQPIINAVGEKREHKRVQINGVAEYEAFSVAPQSILMNSTRIKKYANVENISLGGLQIVCDSTLSEEQILRMKITIEGYDGKIYAYSQVRWVIFDDAIKKYRAGLDFFYLKDEYIRICNKIVEKISN